MSYTVKTKQKTKQLTDQEIREYHRKRIFNLSLKTIGAVPWLDDATEEQKEWFVRKMKGTTRSWQRWFVGSYFTEEQKKQLELADEDLVRRGIR